MLEKLLIIFVLSGIALLQITLSLSYARTLRFPKKYQTKPRNNPKHWGWGIVELFTSRE